MDYVDSPAYNYLNTFGRMMTVGGIETDRQVIHWKQGPKAGTRLTYPK